MRFRFCGELDAPDWLLAEIATLSRISSLRMKGLVKQVLRFVATGGVDAEKVLQLAEDALGTDERASDLEGALAAMDFIIGSAAKHNVEHTTLLQELLQLGLPKENGEALSQQYRDAREELRERLAARSFRLNRLVDLDWRVDYVVASHAAAAGEEEEPMVRLKFLLDERPSEGPAVYFEKGRAEGIQGSARDPRMPIAPDKKRFVETAVTMSGERFSVLYRELRQARELMRSLET